MALIEKKEEEQRTLQQNKALHLFYQHLADELNDGGLDMRGVLKSWVAIPWSKESVKEFLWKPIQELQLRKRSTTELNTKDVDKIYMTLMRHLGEKFGVGVEFPSIEEVEAKQ